MRYYHKNKYVKKINLFSKDAVKSLDTSGARYDTFTWNNIRDLGLYGDCKMKIGSLDFDTFVSEQVATADIQAPVPPIDLVVHYKFDGDFLDSSGYDYHILENEGGVSIDTADYKKGTGSVNFDATLTKGLWIDKISIKQSRISPHLYQNPNGMTISFWVKLTSAGLLGSVWERLFQAHNTTSSSANDYCAMESTGGQKDISFVFAGNGVLSKFTKSITSLADKWFHLTWVMIPESTNWLAEEHTWKIYIDGVLTDTKINMYYPEWNDDWDFALGKWASGVVSGNEREMDGNLDDFRIYDRELSSNEINRIMAEVQKDPIVHYKFDGDFLDSSGNGYDVLENEGDVLIDTADYKRGTGSVDFNETLGDGLWIDKASIEPSRLFLHLHQNPNGMTISFWIKTRSVGGGQYNSGRVFYGMVDTDTTKVFQVYFNSTTSNLFFSIINGTNTYADVSHTVPNNTWYHIAWVIEPNTLNWGVAVHTQKVYINGILNTTKTDSNFPVFSTNYNMVFGKWTRGVVAGSNPPTELEMDGNLDDFRIYDKALDANEIHEVMWADRGLYMWYKFEPVFNNFVASDYLVVHYKFDDDFTDAVGGSDLQIGTGMTTADFSDNFFRRGTHSFRFLDGGTDGNNPGRYGGLFTPPINWGTNTISFWSYQYADYELDKYYNTLWSFGNNEIYFALLSQNPGIVNFSMTISGSASQQTNISCSNANLKDKWYFWSFTFWEEGADVKSSIYLNGVLQQTLTFTNTSFPAITTNNVICAGSADTGSQRKGFGAYIDDFRIYSKVLTEDEIQNLYSKYLTFQDGMYNTIMTDEYSGFDVSTIKKVGKYALDLSSGVKGGSITLTDGNINVFQNLQRLSICFWGFLSSKVDHQYHWVLYQENVMGVLIDTANMSCYVTIGLQVKFWDISDIIDTWKHYTVIIDYSETEPIKKMMLYIDGVDQGPGTMYGTNNTLTAFPEATKKLYIGSHNGSSIGFAGYIDDFRVYNFQVTPEDITSIMITEEKGYLFSVKCKEVYDTYESDYKIPTIYHNRGTFRNKHIINPYFKINRLHNSLTSNVNKYENSTLTPKGLETTDDFMITLLVEEDDKKELEEGIRIEYYHRNPQFKIKY